MVFASDSMAAVCNVARKAATNDLPVLIQGEAGTGKELMARAVHFFSTRKAFPFLAQNCGALPDELLQSELFGHKRGAYTGAVSDRLGLFPAADGGTVFLDEISDVSPTFQVSLSLSVPGWPSSAASWVATRATRAGRVPVTSIHPERNSPSPASAIMRRTSFSSSRTVQALETHLVTQSLLPHRWNHSRAARELGLSRVGLANKIKRYGLDRKDAV
jgi:transcriptional regulator with GAF, ATPase, and Fis domain